MLNLMSNCGERLQNCCRYILDLLLELSEIVVDYCCEQPKNVEFVAEYCGERLRNSLQRYSPFVT